MAALPVGQPQDAVDRVLSKTSEVAVLPQVVYKVMEMTASTDSAASHLERAIVIDPGFSAKILTQANSAYYALPRKVSSIKEAVAYLGFRSVRQLAMAMGVFDLFVGKNDKESIRRRGWWRRSLDTAVGAKLLAEKLAVGSADEGYTVGLLHYIGKTLMDRSEPKQYEKVLALEERGATTIMSECAVFGCDHIMVGQAAAAKWSFPEMLIAGLDYMNEPEANDPHAKLRAIVAIADLFSGWNIEGLPADSIDAESLQCWPAKTLGLTNVESTKCVYSEAREAIASAVQLSF